MYKIILILVINILKLVYSQVNYTNYKLVGLNATKQEHLNLIKKWHLNQDFDVWNHLRSIYKEVDVLLSPNSLESYKKLFEKYEISYRIKNENIQNEIDKEIDKNLTRTIRLNTSFNHDKYLSYEQILNLIYQMSVTNPSFVSTYSAGKTFENRDLMVLKIKTPSARRSVWIDCGIHAREWISISTCVYIMNRFIDEYNKNVSSTVWLLNYYEVHILPVLNPDGYDYSFKVNRMWRKNRNPNDRRGCFGVDLNRNFGYYWLTAGSSRYYCSDTYAGKSADSEPEVRAVQKAIMSNKGRWDSYLTFHSYGQFFFTPWGFTYNLPIDYNDLVEKARVAVSAIRSVDGSEFTIGSSSNLLYTSSGGSEDWAKAIAGVKYAYCVELRPKDGNNLAGFIVPENQIAIAGEELYQGVKALYAEIIRN